MSTVVVQLLTTLCNPMDYSLPGSSVHGVGTDKDCLIHLYEVPNSQIQRVRKYIGRCQGPGVGRGSGDLVLKGDIASV